MDRNEIYFLFTQCRNKARWLRPLEEARFSEGISAVYPYQEALEDFHNACVDFADYFCREHADEFIDKFDIYGDEE